MSDQSSKNSAPVKSGAKLFHRKDLWLASVIIAFGAFMYYEAGKFPSAPSILGDTLNADVFPKILVIMLICLACILPIEFKITPEKIVKIDKERDEKTIPITWMTIVMLLTITSLSSYLGAVLTMFTTAIVFPLVWGERNYIAVAVYAVVFPFLVFLLFNKVLGLYMEPGLLEFLKR